MTHRVLYTDNFTDEVRAQVAWLRKEGAPEHVIDAWFGRLFDVLDALSTFPHRCPIDAIERERTGADIRKVIFETWIALYRVDDEQRLVYMLSFVNGPARSEA